MTEPTDADLRAWVQELIASDDSVRTNDERDHMNFARAVLAKWGAPPVVVGEPVAVVRYTETRAVVDWYGLTPPSGARLYTTPQPTQAQAGAVVVTTDTTGRCVAVTRQDEEGRVLSVIWQAPEAQAGAVPLPKSYQGSTLTSNSHDAGCRVSFSFSSVAEAEAWHESIVDQHHGIK